jgi:phage shock protein PspC (stress-responsive transcriptional regulator)
MSTLLFIFWFVVALIVVSNLILYVIFVIIWDKELHEHIEEIRKSNCP